MIPPRGIKKSGGQKRPPTYGVFEIKKISWGGSVIINQKEIKLGPHRGPLKMVPPRGIKNSGGQKRPPTYGVFEIKKISWGGSVIINQKEIKLGPHRGSPKGWSRHGGQAGPEAWNPAAGNQTATYWKSQINFLKRLEYCMHEYWLL